jgi:hypothetical protein
MSDTLFNLLTDYIIPIVVKTAVIWIPIICFLLFQYWWKHSRRLEYLAGLKWSLLEIKIPKDVHKTPEAMEFILTNALYQTGGVGTWFDRNWKGKLMAYSTLEIVSIEGNIYFFIRVEERFKNLVETQVYSQYPTAEITEVEDYTKFVPKFEPGGDWEVRAFEMKLEKEDAYPIKTYIDYGMDSKSLQLDEEQKIDPMTPFLEFLGSLKPGEQLWTQIFVRAAGKDLKLRETTGEVTFFKHLFGEKEEFLHLRNDKGEVEDWHAQGRRLINKMMDDYASTSVDIEGKKTSVGGYRNLPPDKKDLVDRLERNIAKFGFDVGIRILYYAKKEAFNGMRVPPEVTSALRQFAAPKLSTYNSLVMNPAELTNNFDFPWQDWNDIRVHRRQKKQFELYVQRAYFYPPATSMKPFLKFFEVSRDGKVPFTLNSEELATIFHFPGRVSTTGSFERIAAQKAEPPANLPI